MARGGTDYRESISVPRILHTCMVCVASKVRTVCRIANGSLPNLVHLLLHSNITHEKGQVRPGKQASCVK